MNVPDKNVTRFDMKMDNSYIEFYLIEELIDMCADLEAKSLFKGLTLCEHWSNVNTNNKYPRLSAAVEPLLPEFPISYMVEAGLSHANSIITKEINRINQEERSDLCSKLTNFQPKISALACTHQSDKPVEKKKMQVMLLFCINFLKKKFFRG